MLNESEVIHTTAKGVNVTFGDLSKSEAMLRHVLHHAVKRMENSAKGAGSEEEKAAKAEKFWQDIKAGIISTRGGGNRLSAFDKEWRNIAIAQLVSYGKKQTDAEKDVRENADAVLAAIAKRKLKDAGKDADKASVEAVAQKVRDAIDAKAKQLVEARALDVEI